MAELIAKKKAIDRKKQAGKILEKIQQTTIEGGARLLSRTLSRTREGEGGGYGEEEEEDFGDNYSEEERRMERDEYIRHQRKGSW